MEERVDLALLGVGIDVLLERAELRHVDPVLDAVGHGDSLLGAVCLFSPPPRPLQPQPHRLLPLRRRLLPTRIADREHHDCAAPLALSLLLLDLALKGDLFLLQVVPDADRGPDRAEAVRPAVDELENVREVTHSLEDRGSIASARVHILPGLLEQEALRAEAGRPPSSSASLANPETPLAALSPGRGETCRRQWRPKMRRVTA